MIIIHCKWFEPRSHIIIKWSTIVLVSEVLRRTVWDDIDWRFDNLSGSHLQSQVICVTSVGTIRTPMSTTSRTLQMTHWRHQQTNKTLIYSHSTAQRILRYAYRPWTYRRTETHLSLFSLPSQSHQGSTDSRPITSRISWPMCLRPEFL